MTPPKAAIMDSEAGFPYSLAAVALPANASNRKRFSPMPCATSSALTAWVPGLRRAGGKLG